MKTDKIEEWIHAQSAALANAGNAQAVTEELRRYAETCGKLSNDFETQCRNMWAKRFPKMKYNAKKIKMFSAHRPLCIRFKAQYESAVNQLLDVMRPAIVEPIPGDIVEIIRM